MDYILIFKALKHSVQLSPVTAGIRTLTYLLFVQYEYNSVL